ncbi:hypothetical protein [Dactylosporangium matsuzakiense]|uniref:Saccharopine dehydrogenase n=1 Tax=Dactylosporangium matsuzakiense TaxID=53360 RepID=A0A9W6NNI4_9ACTN|nr:hypothetical protein [Dactylosporangium matsuzakiense]UWZ40870.1 hypothetical protein Dmats_24340 [Dactylosporangium matsuzakiense]GLL03479.1 hypothetical protein GCM10017581_052250 [Dactylosporangium matsuzakiense]
MHVAYGLDGWHPTPGTLAASAVSHERRGGRRVRFTGGRLEYHDDPPRTERLAFPEPIGERDVIAEFSMADIVTIPSHLAVPEVRTSMTVTAARDLAAAGERGPEPESFVVDAVVHRRGERRRATAHGRDIYAVTAPLAAEAVCRILAGRTRTTGVASAGAMFDAADFLTALAPAVTITG